MKSLAAGMAVVTLKPVPGIPLWIRLHANAVTTPKQFSLTVMIDTLHPTPRFLKPARGIQRVGENRLKSATP